MGSSSSRAAAAALVAAGGAAYLHRRRRALQAPLSAHAFKRFKLVERHELGPQVRLLVFEVPFGKRLELPTGKHVQIAFYENGEQVLRSYTPTEASVPGRFDLLMKVYPNGKMGGYLDRLKVGECALVRGPTGRVSYSPGKFSVGQRVVRCAHILMLAGGTGITPMAQIVKEVLRNAGRDKTSLTLIFASSTPADVLLYHELAGFAEKHPKQLKLVLTVSQPTAEWAAKARAGGSPHAYETGRISKEMLLKHSPQFVQQRPFPDWTVAGYCGPPAFEACAKALLESIGYSGLGVNLFRW